MTGEANKTLKTKNNTSIRSKHQKGLPNSATSGAGMTLRNPVRETFFVVGELNHTFALKPAHTKKPWATPPARSGASSFAKGVGGSYRKRSLHSRLTPQRERRWRTAANAGPSRFGVSPGQTVNERFANAANGLRTFGSGHCCMVRGMKHSALCFRPVSLGGGLVRCSVNRTRPPAGWSVSGAARAGGRGCWSISL